jgi:CO dehydrogenase/acetyl-CoA synthase epsilon subunit
MLLRDVFTRAHAAVIVLGARTVSEILDPVREIADEASISVLTIVAVPKMTALR